MNQRISHLQLPPGVSISDDDTIFAPQPGPQTDFMYCQADLCIFGGAAYGGKSYALLLEPFHAKKPDNTMHPYFTGVIFRRETPQITSGGGLWDTSHAIFGSDGARPREHRLEWVWDSGAKVKFTHLQLEKDKLAHQGAQYVFIGFDELTHFTETQFWYLWTRNRPPSGYIGKCWCRATTNPDADSWVRELIDWWIGEDGYPIRERSGVLRYFTREDEKIIWVDKDWRDQDGNPPKSITFIPSYIDDNPLGLISDPSYRTNLLAQDRVTRERLLRGNWNITYQDGMFDPTWFVLEDESPKDIKLLRYWDLAATEKVKEDDDPDWTASALCGFDDYGDLWILDVQRFRTSPGKTERKIRATAERDGTSVPISIEEEKGSSGKYVSHYLQRTVLRGFEVHPDPVTGQKIDRAKPWAALAERGGVHLLRGDWNRMFLAEAGSFPMKKKDMIDSVSGAYKMLATMKRVFFAYNPRSAIAEFKKTKLDFEKANPSEVEIFIVMNMEKNESVCISFFLWARRSRRLKIYNESYHLNASIPEIIYAIRDLSVVPVKVRSKDRLKINSIYANDVMFKRGGGDAKKAFKKAGLRIRESVGYDRAGSTLKANHMFSEGRIIVHKDCEQTDSQFRTWKIDETSKKPDDEPFYGMCHNLLVAVNELSAMGELKAEIEPPPYSDYKESVRKKLYEGKVPTITERNENEWLTA